MELCLFAHDKDILNGFEQIVARLRLVCPEHCVAERLKSTVRSVMLICRNKGVTGDLMSKYCSS